SEKPPSGIFSSVVTQKVASPTQTGEQTIVQIPPYFMITHVQTALRKAGNYDKTGRARKNMLSVANEKVRWKERNQRKNSELLSTQGGQSSISETNAVGLYREKYQAPELESNPTYMRLRGANSVAGAPVKGISQCVA
ncbi:hypothetical protein V1477_004208, partial [Vespula maculifrons]